MQPHPPQLPTDTPTSPAPRSLKKGTLLLLAVVAAVVALVAFMLPKKQVEANKVPASEQQRAPGIRRAQSDAYKAPTH